MHFCPDEASLLEKCREVFAGRDIFGYRNTEILLQEFLRGTEYIVNTASCRGRHAVTDIWRYDKIPLGDLGNPYNYAALVMQPTEIEKPIVDYVMAVLDALGFEYGPSHTEIMLTAQGPRLIETGARPMGGFFPPAELRDSLGHEIVDIALDTLLAPEAFEAFRREPYAPVKPALLKIVVSSAAYKVGDIHYEALLMEAPAARCWEFDFVRAHGGTAVSVDLESAAGEVYLSDENPEKVCVRVAAPARVSGRTLALCACGRGASHAHARSSRHGRRALCGKRRSAVARRHSPCREVFPRNARRHDASRRDGGADGRGGAGLPVALGALRLEGDGVRRIQKALIA